MTSIERTAYPQFKRLTSARVLHVFFTPAAAEEVVVVVVEEEEVA